MHRVRFALALSAALLVAACGGGDDHTFNGGSAGGGTGTGSGTGTGGTTPTGDGLNTIAVVVDAGPAGAGGTANTLFTTVTLCAPGSTTACQTIDHVQVDTGSTGFRILASTFGATLAASQLPQTSDGSGTVLDECVQFADGYSWGTVRTADLTVGNRVASGIPIQVIGDASEAPVPASCVLGPEENTLATFGANAILGVGNFLTDCGSACASSVVSGTYYACNAGGACTGATVDESLQLQNPVATFAQDNNGVVITLPAATAPASAVTGTMTFGIATQSNNTLGSAQIYTVDPDYATFTSVFNGATFDSSFIDTGSNAYYFSDDTIPTCADAASFYCPAGPLALTATIQGLNGLIANVPFIVDNADTDFATGGAVLPSVAGPQSATNAKDFDWGLPFFYGRTVYVAFEGGSTAGVQGPWIAF